MADNSLRPRTCSGAMTFRLPKNYFRLALPEQFASKAAALGRRVGLRPASKFYFCHRSRTSAHEGSAFRALSAAKPQREKEPFMTAAPEARDMLAPSCFNVCVITRFSQFAVRDQFYICLRIPGGADHSPALSALGRGRKINSESRRDDRCFDARTD